jgi:hypothetical protein
MTAVYREEARDALRRERARASRLERTNELVAGLKRDVSSGGPAILSHLVVYDIIARLERLAKIEKLVDG